VKKNEILRWLDELEKWVRSRAEVDNRGTLPVSDLQELKRRLQVLVVRLPG